MASGFPYLAGTYTAAAGGVDIPCGATILSGDNATVATFTASAASPSVINPGSGFIRTPYNGMLVTMTGGSVPAEFTAGAPYWVVGYNSSTGNFSLAATSGGTAVSSVAGGSGTIISGPGAGGAWFGQMMFPDKLTKVFYSEATSGGAPDPTSMGQAPTTLDALTQSYADLGTPCLLMYRTAYAANTDGTGQPTAAQLSASLSAVLASADALAAAGLNIAGIGLNNEPEQSKEVANAKYPTPDQYYAVMEYCYTGSGSYTGIHDAGYALVSTHLGYHPEYSQDFFPGPCPSYPTRVKSADVLGIDWYGEDKFNRSAMPSDWFAYAIAAGMDIAFTELGNSAAGETFTQAQMTQFLSNNMAATVPGDPVNSVQAAVAQAKSLGQSVFCNAWYENIAGGGPNPILSGADYRAILFDAIQTTCAGTTATCGLTTSVTYGDKVIVGILCSDGLIDGVADNQGNSYTLAIHQGTEVGLDLWVYVCGSAVNAAANSSAPALTAGQDIIEVYYTSDLSIQEVVVCGDNGVTAAIDQALGTAGNGIRDTVDIPLLAGYPEHGVAFFATQQAAGAPVVGTNLTQLAQILDPAGTVYLTAAYRILTSVAGLVMQTKAWTTPVNFSGALVTSLAAGSIAFAEDVAIGDTPRIPGTLGDAAAITEALVITGLVYVPFAEQIAVGDGVSGFSPPSNLPALAEQIAVEDGSLFGHAETDFTGHGDQMAVTDSIAVQGPGVQPWVLPVYGGGTATDFTTTQAEIDIENPLAGQYFQFYDGTGRPMYDGEIFTVETE